MLNKGYNLIASIRSPGSAVPSDSVRQLPILSPEGIGDSGYEEAEPETGPTNREG